MVQDGFFTVFTIPPFFCLKTEKYLPLGKVIPLLGEMSQSDKRVAVPAREADGLCQMGFHYTQNVVRPDNGEWSRILVSSFFWYFPFGFSTIEQREV